MLVECMSDMMCRGNSGLPEIIGLPWTHAVLGLWLLPAHPAAASAEGVWLLTLVFNWLMQLAEF